MENIVRILDNIDKFQKETGLSIWLRFTKENKVLHIGVKYINKCNQLNSKSCIVLLNNLEDFENCIASSLDALYNEVKDRKVWENEQHND